MAGGQRRALVVLALVVLLMAVLGGRKVFRWGQRSHTPESIMADSTPPEFVPQHVSQYRKLEVKKVSRVLSFNDCNNNNNKNFWWQHNPFATPTFKTDHVSLSKQGTDKLT